MSEKKLGFGMMRLPLSDAADAGSVDIEYTRKMVDEYLSRGFTYFDTAWMYCNGKSESVIKECVVDRYPRDSFTVTSKLPAYMLNTREDCDVVFNTQLKKTGLEYFDYYFLHDVNSKSLQTFNAHNCFGWLRRKKAMGLVKHIGFSFHDTAEVLDAVLAAHPEIEVVQIQLNYLDYEHITIQSRECYEVATKHGKPVIVMEPVKGGTLSKLPDEAEELFRSYDPSKSLASWAIRFAASHENVKLVLSGMSTMGQLEDNTGYMADFVPLTEEEHNMCLKAAEIIKARPFIACTGCAYCTATCPQGIAIPQYFALYNADMQEDTDKGWTAQENYYAGLTETHGKPSDCIGCRQCERMCPQHLHICSLLKKVSEHFEGEEG